MSRSPLDPAAYDVEPRPAAVCRRRVGGVDAVRGRAWSTIGHDGAGFAFDNEGPRHRVWLEPFAAGRTIWSPTAEWIAFIADGGYRRPELWLADGWADGEGRGLGRAALLAAGSTAAGPSMGLAGRAPVDPDAPVRHISAYEADAFARWAGKRLPTESGVGTALSPPRPTSSPTCSARSGSTPPAPIPPIPASSRPRARPSEYNGKFMANQLVLRGGSLRHADRAMRAPPTATSSIRINDGPSWDCDWRRDAPAGGTRAHRRRWRPPRFRAELTRRSVSGRRRRCRRNGSMTPRARDLFEDITRLPEYYPTRQEAALLQTHGARAGRAVRRRRRPGRVRLGGQREDPHPARCRADAIRPIVPIDISPDALNAAAARHRRGLSAHGGGADGGRLPQSRALA